MLMNAFFGLLCAVTFPTAIDYVSSNAGILHLHENMRTRPDVFTVIDNHEFPVYPTDSKDIREMKKAYTLLLRSRLLLPRPLTDSELDLLAVSARDLDESSYSK